MNRYIITSSIPKQLQKLFGDIFLIVLCMTGCTSYNIPIQTKNHPASSTTSVTQIELSPLLEIKEENPAEDLPTQTQELEFCQHLKSNPIETTLAQKEKDLCPHE